MTANLVPVPTAGLIASLSAYAAVETTANGNEVFGSLLLTHRSQPGAEAEIERQMRGVAASLGLVGPTEVVPDVGDRITVRGAGDIRLRFDGTDYVLRLPLPGAYGPALTALGRVLLAVGLDPLPHDPTLAEREAYIYRTVRADRMFFGSARVLTP